jgi:hypothetical protein
MSGKVNDEDMFRLEKRIKKAEAIIACMTEEERTVPDLIARQVLTKTLKESISTFDSYLSAATDQYDCQLPCVSCDRDRNFIFHSPGILDHEV